jgi:endonuclease III
MKNATKHADELKSLYRKLTRGESKPEPKQEQDALRALVRAAMSYDMPDTKADDAMRAIEKEFVDLNELRVATDLEIHELLGVRYPQIEKRVAMITQALNNIFEREHTMNLDRLKTISRRDARNFLRELPEIHPYVEAYVMLYAFDGHCFPVDGRMLEYLVDEEIIDEDTSLEDAQKFVEHHLNAEQCYELFIALRRATTADRKPRKKAKA